MTLFILDPNLENAHGHHMQWDLSIATAALAREQDVTIIAHKTCPLNSLERIEIIPWFSRTCYADISRDRITGKYDDFCTMNDELAEELRLLPRERFLATDVVLTPTITEKHLLGYVAWMKSFDPMLAPLFIVHLMFPSGLGAMGKSGELTVADPLQTLFYTLAFRMAAGPGPQIHFFCSGRQLAREFSDLLGKAIEAHPVPNCPKRSTPLAGTNARPAALLFAGDAKVDKGFLLVPDLARRLSIAYPNWDFIIHANTSASWGQALDASNELTALGKKHSNVIVKMGHLTHTEYLELLEGVDCYICSYDPAVYARKSSGVIWESISLGIPILAPADTWLDCEPREWGAGHLGYEDYSVEGIVKAFATFSTQLPAMYQRSATAASRFHALNGADAIMDQIGALWAPRLLTASLTIVPTGRSLELDQFETGWHLLEQINGAFMRWTAKDFLITFDWPFPTGWQLKIVIANCYGDEQITGARAFVSGQPAALQASIHIDQSGGVIYIDGVGLDRTAPKVQVRVELPWTYQPENETRHLGLLVTQLTLAPAKASLSDASLTLEIVTPVEYSTDNNAFRLSSIVSGLARLDPAQPGEFAFTVTTDRPDIARAVSLFVNGIPVQLDLAAQGNDLWHAYATCPRSILSRRGYRAEWDLQLTASDSHDSVWIGNFMVSASRTGLPDRLARVLPAETDTGRIFASPKLVASTGLPDVPTVDDVRLNEHFVGGHTYAHLDLSLFGIAAGEEFWAEVRFKFCISHSRSYLEFRNLTGWPHVFSFWNLTETDQYGSLLHLGEDQTLPVAANRRETELVVAIVALLPRAIESVIRRIEHPSPETLQWRERAERASREWIMLTVDVGEKEESLI